MNMNYFSDADLEKKAESRANQLMDEFRRHFLEYAKQDPGARDRHDQIFQGWAIQKIAGLQLCIEHIAERFNAHVQSDE